MNRLALLLALLPACGGAPFTVGYASLASGDDAQTTSPDAGEDSATADPDAAFWGGVDVRDGGGNEDRSMHADAALGSDGWIRSEDSGDALAIGPADAHVDADGASPADSPASPMPDASSGLCCRTEVYPGCTLAWIPVDAGAVNDPCVAPTSCVQAGTVVPCQ